MSDLMPCPFCDGPAKIISGFGQKHSFTATCDSLDECLGQHMEQDEQGGFTADYRTEEDAVKAWNTRAAPKELTAALKKAERALQPFSDKVFNDNGDCTVSDSHLCGVDQYITAYYAYKELRRILSALTPETET